MPNLRKVEAISPIAVLLQFSQRTLQLNKPLYAGFSVLKCPELSCTNFSTNKSSAFSPTLPQRVADTVSFILQIADPDVDSKLANLAETHLHTSGYVCDHCLVSSANKMKLEVFKKEFPKDRILGLVCLKPKLYSLDL